MTLSNQLVEYVAACFTGLWIQSCEHTDALREIAQVARDQGWKLATWDVTQGLQIPGSEQPADAGGTDPLAAIQSVNALASPESSALLVLQNLHRFTSSAEIVQALAHQITLGKQNRTFIIVLSPVVQVPTELEKLFVVLRHELPGRDQIEEIARSIATEDGELPEGDGLETVLDAAAGLTRYEAEGAFSLSLVRHQAIRPDAIWAVKSQTLKKSGLVCGIAGQVRGDDVEHGVTEAADVQNVVTVRRLRRGVGLDVNANQLRAGDAVTAEPHLVLDERLPLVHHAGGAVPTVGVRPVAVDPALAVAHEHAASESPVAVLRVRHAQRQRAVGAAATVAGQPLREAQDRVLRINAHVVRLVVERDDHAVRVATEDRRCEQRRHVHAPHPGGGTATTPAGDRAAHRTGSVQTDGNRTRQVRHVTAGDLGSLM